MNIIILLGRLTKKPEIKYSQANNVKIATIYIRRNFKW